MAASIILKIVKTRLNRTDTALDEYLTARIDAVIGELTETGIHLEESARDNVLVADLVVWQYQNRDKPGQLPEWLRLARRERWLQDRGGTCCDS